MLSSAYAGDDETKDYSRAYNICSPMAHKKTIEQCHYSKMVENFYIICMHKNGFREDDNLSSKNYYKKYMQSHEECTNSANDSAQKECGYGNVYKTHYNTCMLELGFNGNGEKTISSQTENIKKNSADTRSIMSKFIDSFLP